MPHLVVTARDGIVTLPADVANLPHRHAAKRPAQPVGLKARANHMVVRDPGTPGPKDGDLAETANQILQATPDVPHNTVKAEVRDHVITLSGTVTWHHQREAAGRAVKYLHGVTAVANTITLTPTTPITRSEDHGQPGD